MRIAGIPASRRVWIFDLDNTLHDARPHIFPAMHVQINDYIKQKFAVDEAGANTIRAGFWAKYGTTLSGLMRHHGTDPREFLTATHQFPELGDMLVHENALRHALARLGGTKLVFSNAPRHYVEQVLGAMGVRRHFDAVYSIESTRYRPKPSSAGFHVLLRAHKLDPHRCVFVDDVLENLQAAKRLGIATVWVAGGVAKPRFVDLRVASVIDLPRHVLRHASGGARRPTPRRPF
ncbi:MAG: pyrimidine 5'-nucleotidase [Proteobacteria bacterium]|nr:pyrimidine 5'-nucleotidase [Pseudomonadota bacterium]